MKKAIFLMAMFVFFPANVSFAEDDPVFSFDASISAYNEYVGCLSGATFHDEAVIQPSLTVSHNPSGLYANLWASYSPEGGFNSDYGDEVDYIVGINQAIGLVNVDVYYAYYNCYELDRHGDGDVHAIGMTVSFPEIWSIETFAKAEYDFVRGASKENGLMYQIGGNTSPIENLSIGISVGGHTEIYGARTEIASFAKCSASYEIGLAENIFLTPEINFQKRIGYTKDNGGLTDDVIFGGVTISYSF
jgi:hypothetical protein